MVKRNLTAIAREILTGGEGISYAKHRKKARTNDLAVVSKKTKCY